MEPLGRQAAFFGAVHALAQRLRSVFVPYYRYVIDGALTHLGSSAALEAQPKKKRRKSSLAAGEEAALGLQWLVRHRVSRQISHPLTHPMTLPSDAYRPPQQQFFLPVSRAEAAMKS